LGTHEPDLEQIAERTQLETSEVSYVELTLFYNVLVPDYQVLEETMNDNWEKLKGLTYPDTLDAQLKALETDEVIASYREQRERMAE
jgi:hypothetical protein